MDMKGEIDSRLTEQSVGVRQGQSARLRQTPNVIAAQKGIPQYLTQATLPKPSTWAGDIAMWEPIYLKGYGNACRTVNLAGDQAYVGSTSLRILRQLAEHYTIDYTGMRGRYRAFVDRSQWTPLVIAARNEVFFAIKTRVPQEKNDGATGYVADSAVAYMELVSGSHTRVHLHNGCFVDALESRLCLTNRRNSAVLFRRQLQFDGIIPSV